LIETGFRLTSTGNDFRFASGVFRRIRLKAYQLKRKIYFIYKKNNKFPPPPMAKFVDSFMKAVKRSQ